MQIVNLHQTLEPIFKENNNNNNNKKKNKKYDLLRFRVLKDISVVHGLIL